jgi:hypothetical protein
MTPVTLLLAVALAPAQSDAPLAWKLKKGDTFYVKTTNDMKQTVEVLGQKQNQDQKQTTYHKYEVLSADKDGMVIEQTIQKADMKSPIPGAGELGDKMKGIKMKFTLNAKNEATKVEGYEKFVEALGGDNDMIKEMMKAMMSEDTLMLAVNDVFGFLPAKAVKKGDTWKRDYKFGLGPLGDFAMNTEYKLAESSDKGEKITWKATTKYGLPKGDGGGLPFTITKGDLKAEKFEGEYLFDAKAGRLKSGATAAKMAGKLTITVMGMDIEMEMNQDLTTKIEVTDKSQADE